MQKLLGNKKEGLVFVVSGPAGTGKSTLVQMLLSEFKDSVVQSCSCTTRAPRSGEKDGREYHFLSSEQFEAKVAAGEFLEHASVFGHHYGTLEADVRKIVESGKHAILVIDIQGGMRIKEKIDAHFIFITPPSPEELKARLFKRRTESEEKIKERLKRAAEEIEMARFYDYHLLNDNLDVAYQIFRSIVIAEEHKRRSYEHRKRASH